MNNWKAKLKSIVGFNSSSNSQNNNEGRIPQAPAPSNNGQIPLRMPQNRTNHFPPQISETREQIQDRQKQIKNGQNQAWLDSERLWQVRVGPGWVAQKVLGQGSEGIVGWWQYREIGGDENFLGLKNVAVKQNVMRYHVSNGRGLNQEAWFYRFLGRAQSQHIPKMYRELYQDVGRNTQDADRGPVERIFLEFCPGGDLQNLIDRRMDKEEPFSEKESWEIFHCLARGTHVLRYQSVDENDLQINLDGQEVCHLDIKPGNVLIGEITTDGEHDNTAPIKLADFGFSKIVPEVQDQQFFIESHAGTPQGLPPELIQDQELLRYITDRSGGSRPWIESDPRRYGDLVNTHPLGNERRYGSATNVWAIGLIIWCMMRGYKDPPWDDYGWNTRLKLIPWGNPHSELFAKGPSVGTVFDRDGEARYKQAPYSEALWRCVFECLLYRPSKRPPVEDLVKRTQDGMRAARAFDRGWGPAPDYTPYAEPSYSDRWNTGGRGLPSSLQVGVMRKAVDAARVLESARLAKESKKQKEDARMLDAGMGAMNLKTVGRQAGSKRISTGVNQRGSVHERTKRLKDEVARAEARYGIKVDGKEEIHDQKVSIKRDEEHDMIHRIHLSEQKAQAQRAKIAKIDKDIQARRHKADIVLANLKRDLLAAMAADDEVTARSFRAQIDIFKADEDERVGIEEHQKVERDAQAKLALYTSQRNTRAAQPGSKRKSAEISQTDSSSNRNQGRGTQGTIQTRGADNHMRDQDPKRRKDTGGTYGNPVRSDLANAGQKQTRPNTHFRAPYQKNQVQRDVERLMTGARNPAINSSIIQGRGLIPGSFPNQNSRTRDTTSRIEKTRSNPNTEQHRREKIDRAAAIKALEEFEKGSKEEEKNSGFLNVGLDKSKNAIKPENLPENIPRQPSTRRDHSRPSPDYQGMSYEFGDPNISPPPKIIPRPLPDIRVRINEGHTMMGPDRIYILHLHAMITDMSILDVKKKIERFSRYQAIKAWSMRLFVGGEELLNSKCLGDYGDMRGEELLCLKS